MRYLRTTLLALTAVAAIAVASPMASAMTIEPRYDDDETPCSSVSLSGTDVDGGCLLHATSEGGVAVKNHTFGVEATIATCSSEFHARIDEAGEGYVLEQVLTNPPGLTCTAQACKSSGEQQPWPMHVLDAGGGEEALGMTVCLEPLGGGTDATCELDLPFYETEDENVYEVGGEEVAAHGGGGFNCEVEGHWNTEVGATHDGEEEEEIALFAPVSIISTTPRPAVTPYNGDLLVKFTSVISTVPIGPRSCSTVEWKPHVVSPSAPPAASYIDQFNFASFTCDGTVQGKAPISNWKGTINHSAMTMTFTDVDIEDIGLYTCRYKGNITGDVVNPTGASPMTITFNAGSDTLPKIAGPAFPLCSNSAGIGGTYQVHTTPGAANVWLTWMNV